MPLDRRRPPTAVIARLRRYMTTLPVAPVAPVAGPTMPRRENDALELVGTAPPVYRNALAKAYRLGSTDGRIAAAFDCEGADLSGCTCRGRDPLKFAAYLWADRPGPVPAGLEINARLWYLTGLTDGAAVQACDPGQ